MALTPPPFSSGTVYDQPYNKANAFTHTNMIRTQRPGRSIINIK
jgi:hypothetical protein